MTGLSTILVLAVYPASSATTRLRAEQFEPYLRSQGMELRLWTFLARGDVTAWQNGRIWRRIAVLARSALRTFQIPRLVRRAAAVIVLREVLPFGPPLFERFISGRRPMIWDVDDAVWQPYRSHFFPRLPSWARKSPKKYAGICRAATQVWAASEVIAAWCREHNRSVTIIPTVVPVPQALPERMHRPIIGWIGTPATGEFLSAVLPALGGVCPSPEVLVVGATVPAGALSVQTSTWSPAAERQALENISVGLYPIDREHPLAEGKAGLKAILYMSQAIPCVLTPTTTNRSIVRDEMEGLYAETLQDWHRQVERLLNDLPLWQRCSRRAHSRAYEHYSLHKWGPVVADNLLAILNPASDNSPEKA